MDFDGKKSREWQFNFAIFRLLYRKRFSRLLDNEIAFSIKCKFPLFEVETNGFIVKVIIKFYIAGIKCNCNKHNISTLQIQIPSARNIVNFCIGAFFQKSFYYAVDICFRKN